MPLGLSTQNHWRAACLAAASAVTPGVRQGSHCATIGTPPCRLGHLCQPKLLGWWWSDGHRFAQLQSWWVHAVCPVATAMHTFALVRRGKRLLGLAHWWSLVVSYLPLYFYVQVLTDGALLAEEKMSSTNKVRQKSLLKRRLKLREEVERKENH